MSASNLDREDREEASKDLDQESEEHDPDSTGSIANENY